MQFIIVTGMSGAGKSTVLKCLEDYGFYCVDNIPPVLLPEFIRLCADSGPHLNQVAFGIDVRVGSMFNDLYDVLDKLKISGHICSVIFLDSDDKIINKRYKETRRNHPLSKNGRIISVIEREREILAPLRKTADHVIDTSFFLTRQLKEVIHEIYFGNKEFNNLFINVITFGFKYGIPEDSDLCFDVRFMPNPFYIDELREHTGLDECIKEFVKNSDGYAEFLEKTSSLLDFLIPRYASEGKNKLVISVGCTGGKHRSVCLAEEIYAHFISSGQSAVINHRDITK